MNGAEEAIDWFLYGNNATHVNNTRVGVEANISAGAHEAVRLAQTPAGLFFTAALVGVVLVWLWNWKK